MEQGFCDYYMSENNPWIKRASRLVYENPWMTVFEDDVVRPDGKDGIYGYIEVKTAVGCVALTEEQEIYLVGQYRYPINRYSWEIIEGGVEAGEDNLAAIKRELMEEAGLTAKNWRQLGGEIYISNCISSEVGYLYVATDVSEGQSSPEGTEQLQVRKLPLQRALAMIDSGEITDSLSIIALLRLYRSSVC